MNFLKRHYVWNGDTLKCRFCGSKITFLPNDIVKCTRCGETDNYSYTREASKIIRKARGVDS